MSHSLDDFPSTQSLPLFQPHRTSFACVSEVDKLPPIDAQADAWFREARALEDPLIYVEDRDYKKIVVLTRQAAERRHWMAMLNLASFYVQGIDPPHGVADAVLLVEEGMRLGIPAAYDRMGTFYANGTGVPADATKAYAFWQKAADLGNPHAQAYLGEKLSAGEDGGGHWSNIPIAIKMLECGLSQGLGSAAYELAFLYPAIRSNDGTIIGAPTRETKERALRVLHEGVKFGCADCANKLSIEFDRPRNLSRMLAPHIDKARGARYDVLGDALSFNPSRRLPNLDKILPLPPAELPPWDGKRESLLAAAMGVSFAPQEHVTSAATPAQLKSRHFLDPAYTLRTTGQRTDQSRAPFAGYWRPNLEEDHGLSKQQLERILPGLYRAGELFDSLPIPREGPRLQRVTWEHLRTVRLGYPEAVDPQAVAGLTRVVPREKTPISCRAGAVCPVSGIWQPWVPADHPLQGTVNQPWRQTWSVAGQAFPDPQRDWLLNLPASDVTWHLMERSKKN